MIPTFPAFKNLEWSDREAVEDFTKRFPPYSDFNFTSLWTWNTRDKMMLSQLHGNLILLFYDYMTEQPFLSFIGSKKLCDTAHCLIEYSKLQYKEPCLKLIPEEVAMQLDAISFSVTPDENSHDYILSVPYLNSLSTITSRTAHPAGFLCQKFMREHSGYSVHTCTTKDCIKECYIDLFKRWAKIKELNYCDLSEYSAFEKFIQNEEGDNHLVSLSYAGDTVGFMAYEILADHYSICHFVKANIKFKGAYECLKYEVGKILQRSKVEYLNFEQDLGILGLRQSKKKYKPEFYLKKFIVGKN